MARCEGEWEFRESFILLSGSNPGWSVKINVSDTALEEASIPLINFIKPATDWYECFLNDALFVGSEDPSKLEIILQVFQDLIENGIPSAAAHAEEP
ncbi:Imm53 family immunity protein [Hymenobacter glacieicola]|uniref:Uncharacterized protein n=1 Tax=Hymenobacter glacieicola TaxID=1562124 RepID=A0ABQ1X5U7_9BACT|nr:Imm53 family immunity protein [Hymenobacter glacieicola]GGG60234.1 hypothetical protein GCM10011378_40260 [Hymenobacter glacieicola]